MPPYKRGQAAHPTLRTACFRRYRGCQDLNLGSFPFPIEVAGIGAKLGSLDWGSFTHRQKVHEVHKETLAASICCLIGK
ncbi:hypothetical protein [Lunatimonas lonarensis]|uniref:hypothetical protein n=1 Tax=Lunatimonas lonarensis TaxID=1232681 RepID=UPI0012DD32F7|nr:hypothetical protein [Lunatimonas lonarensis]